MQQGKTITFASLFSEVSNVEIPIIQRDYAQGREEAWEIRDQFLHSISQALTAPADALPLDLDFIYGNLSTEQRPTLSVLDGQQRLTTLFLLHWYLANKESKYADFSERFTHQGKSRFTYQTRTAATEFFHALVWAPTNSGLNFVKNAPALRDQITDSSWFYHSWLQDPTVSASLTMLNAIQSCFGHAPGELYAKLCSSDSQSVVFQYLNLSSFGLSDDLYIKMNSRGKSLTDFENFKAWLSGQMSQQPGAVTFGEKIDQAWTDMFWTLSKKSTESFDTLFLRFFKRMAFLLECSQSTEPAYLLANQSAAWFNTLRSTREGFSNSEFEVRNTFNSKNIQILSSVLDFLCSPHATREHRSLLMEFLTGFDLLGACRFYALCAFITSWKSSNDAYLAEHHAQWTRVTDNFLYTVRIDSPVAVGVIRSLDELAPYADAIYSYMSSVDVRVGFNDQWDEEALKAKLIILDIAWEPALIRAESHPHLKGRVRGLLQGAKNADNDEYDLTRFKLLTEKTYWILNERVLNNSEHLLERALLSLGDYLIWQKGRRYTFCLPSHQSWRERNENWLRVTEKNVFIELLDKLIKKEDMSDKLREIIQQSNPGGWRELVIRDPEAIRYCSERIIDKLDNQVYLLSKTNLRGYFKELHSWVLSKKLSALLRKEDGNTPFTAVTYHPVYGDEWPCIELTVNEGETFFIAHEHGIWFDCQNMDDEGEPLPLPAFFQPLADTLMQEAVSF